ncbi:hypothetical protein MmiAt1_01600 [Methanimicrococcus sp. At1]|uniref:Uncharacterized protein n=1 Tax=Methanimicrococcus hacksteinii TaxID=3028293 RepID=A0ABU3VMJ3_9EURY|nr:InlB B-repeat-containing protein [Methanimicrococcus sp. At1]MDV0444628.1 hypothetical protein [Methanimicrococcus sp. At1]
MKFKRNFTLLFAVSVVLLMLSGIAAANPTVIDIQTNGGACTINGDGEYLIQGSGSLTHNVIYVTGGNPTITLKNVNIQNPELSAISLFGNANVTLILEGENTLKGGTDAANSLSDQRDRNGKAGIEVPDGCNLTVKGGGKLTVTGGDGMANSGDSNTKGGGGAGIGGNGGKAGDITKSVDDRNGGNGGNSGKITILSGTIIATGGKGSNGLYQTNPIGGGAGIGGGGAGDGGDGKFGGNLYWRGGNGGNGGHSDTITIKGGIITATGNNGAAGIGGGAGADGGAAYDTGKSNGNGGNGGNASEVVIEDGIVEASGGSYGVGIGGGKAGSGRDTNTAVDGGNGGVGGSNLNTLITGGNITAIGIIGIGGGSGGIGGFNDYTLAGSNKDYRGGFGGSGGNNNLSIHNGSVIVLSSSAGFGGGSGGDGGNGGSSWGGARGGHAGNGGNGGNNHVELIDGNIELNSVVGIAGGNGANGGIGGTASGGIFAAKGGDGGFGGSGGFNQLNIANVTLLINSSNADIKGGDGGNGGNAGNGKGSNPNPSAGGSGGNGGSNTVTISGQTADVITQGKGVVNSTGGGYGLGYKSTANSASNGKAGSAGSGTVKITSGSLLMNRTGDASFTNGVSKVYPITFDTVEIINDDVFHISDTVVTVSDSSYKAQTRDRTDYDLNTVFSGKDANGWVTIWLPQGSSSLTFNAPESYGYDSVLVSRSVSDNYENGYVQANQQIVMANLIEITFDPNGGTFSDETIGFVDGVCVVRGPVTSGDLVPVPDLDPEWSGLTFAGWFKETDADHIVSNEWDDKSTFEDMASGNVRKLYAGYGCAVETVLENAASDNEAEFVMYGSSYKANITADEGHTLGTVTVTMGGEALAGAVSDNAILISSVTGDIKITGAASAVSYTLTVNVDSDSYDFDVLYGTLIDQNLVEAFLAEEDCTFTGHSIDWENAEGLGESMSAAGHTVTLELVPLNFELTVSVDGADVFTDSQVPYDTVVDLVYVQDALSDYTPETGHEINWDSISGLGTMKESGLSVTLELVPLNFELTVSVDGVDVFTDSQVPYGTVVDSDYVQDALSSIDYTPESGYGIDWENISGTGTMDENGIFVTLDLFVSNSVVFDANGGSFPDSDTKSVPAGLGDFLSKPDFDDLIVPEGKRLAGWSEDEFSILANFDFAETPVTEDLVLYAVWEDVPVVVEIVFNANGGNFSGDVTEGEILNDDAVYTFKILYGSAIPDPEGLVTLTPVGGAELIGWVTDKGIKWEFGADGYTIEDGIYKLELTAAWSTASNFVKFDINAEDGYFIAEQINEKLNVFEVEVPAGNAVNEPQEYPPENELDPVGYVSPRNYELSGWFLQGQEEAWNFGEIVAEDMTLCAAWKSKNTNPDGPGTGKAIISDDTPDDT